MARKALGDTSFTGYTPNRGDPASGLKLLAQSTYADLLDPVDGPILFRAARQIIQDVPAHDEMAELQAIFDAVQTGTSAVPALRRGVRYTRDPVFFDFFTLPGRLLRECAEGACAEDCDGHAALIVALSSVIGWTAGFCICAADPNSTTYDHVYAVVRYPKFRPTEMIVMDTTVPGFNLNDCVNPHPTVNNLYAFAK